MVEVLGHRSRTFQVNGRQYSIVAITGLAPGSSVAYEVLTGPDFGSVWISEAGRSLPARAGLWFLPRLDRTCCAPLGACRCCAARSAASLTRSA
ncbi:MAG: hypothetical protein LC790_05250 [Actinobacteria bacterium]|nr:hypothetical protein [Actinomycetota bacterium]